MTVLRTRAGISAMWVFVMLTMAYNDIFSFMDAGILKQFLEGHVDQIQITPTFLLIAAIATEIPLAMVILSRILPDRVNRWANIVVALYTIVYVVGMGSLMPHYVFLAGLEVLGCGVIAWNAWQMREPATTPALA
jgi:preprotein translocase subunit Sec61beta